MRNFIMTAAQIAQDSHRGQVRKYNNQPYITHPGRVASSVMLLPEATEAMVAAAWMHDVFEDTETSEAAMRSSLAAASPVVDQEVIDRTIELVRELTNVYTKEAFPKTPRAERKQLELDRIKTITDKAKLIKICDRVDNLREMDPKDGFSFTYLEESMSLYDALNSVQEEPLPIYQKVSRAELCMDFREAIDRLLLRIEKHRTLREKLAEVYGVFE